MSLLLKIISAGAPNCEALLHPVFLFFFFVRVVRVWYVPLFFLSCMLRSSLGFGVSR